MRILVVSGFLGAGKTTFIKELARRTREDFSVMENEYGQVGIDGQLLAEKEMPESGEEDAGKLNIWELTEGCICCSMKSDFASSILTIANTIDPEYLIVEPTGVGMLSNVMNNIRLIQYERISLLSPITILDGNSFDRYCQEFPDIYRDQIASAGCVLVSKMEGAERQTLEELEQRIRQINPNAEIFTTHYSANPDFWWESLLSCPADPTQKLPGKAETPDLQNLSLTEVSLPSGNQLLLFLQGVVAGVFGDICRAKGYLPVGSGEQTAWLRFDVVDHNYSITGIEAMPDSRAVLIGKGLKKNWLREVLQKNFWVTEKK